MAGLRIVCRRAGGNPIRAVVRDFVLHVAGTADMSTPRGEKQSPPRCSRLVFGGSDDAILSGKGREIGVREGFYECDTFQRTFRRRVRAGL